MRSALVMLLLAGAGNSEQVRLYYGSALQLFHSLDYERALDQLRKARALVHDVPGDVAISLLEGVLLADLGKRIESDAAFRAALTLDGGAQLPVDVSPALNQRFEALRAAVEKQRALLPPEAKPEPAPETQPVLAPVEEPQRAPPVPSPPAAAVVSPLPELERPHRPVWIPLAVGGVALATSAVAFVERQQAWDALNGPASLGSLTRAQEDALTRQGQVSEAAAFVAAGVGVAALATAAAMAWWGRSGVVIAPVGGPGAGGLAAAGVW